MSRRSSIAHALRGAPRRLAAALTDALIPAALTAAGFALVAAGLLTYLAPAAAAPEPTQTTDPFAFVTPSQGRLTLPPLGPSASASIDPNTRGPTRVVISALGIDLPIVHPPPNETFPLCGVAEYLPEFSRPGLPGATFIYAHARTGMFLPFLTLERQGRLSSLMGDLVEIYTDDNLRFLYQVTKLIPHHTPDNLNDASAVTDQEVWLQTSEGATKESTKLEVIATPLGPPLPADESAAHPKYTGYTCPDANTIR